MRRSRAPLALALAIGLLGLESAHVSAAHARDVTVTVDPTRQGKRVPQRFLGLSVEMSTIRRTAGYATRGNLVRLMRSLGPGVLRLGGISADADSAWVPEGGVKPPWAHDAITAADFAGIATLLKKTGWTVMITVNLARFESGRAAQQVAAARAHFGRRLVGVQIGNEPDNYATHLKLRPGTWGANAHAEEVEAYRRAIARAAPGTPIVGPDLASWNRLEWLSSFAHGVQPRILTAHYYPLPSCTENPSLRSLTSPATREAQTDVLRNLSEVARSAGVPLRLTETGSGPCGGQDGVSDAPASALWTVDYLLRVARAGISGVNFHGGPGRCFSYSPICTLSDSDFVAGRVTERPMWYGLLMTRRLTGARFVATTAVSRAGLEVTGLRAANGRLHVVVVNTDRAKAGGTTVHIQVPARFSRGTVLRLQAAPKNGARGVRLGGRRVRADGTWRTARLPRITRRAGDFRVRVAPGSAALVTLMPAAR